MTNNNNINFINKKISPMRINIYLFFLMIMLVACQHEKDTPLIPPTITSINPQSGGAYTLLTINGSNFSVTPAENTVTIGGKKVNVESCTSTSITILVPESTEGDLPIVVSTKDGQAKITFRYTYTVYVAGYQTLYTGKHIAKYWINGKEKLLPYIDDNTSITKAYSIFVDGKDRYIAGTSGQAIYWKNDSLVTLSQPFVQSDAYSIFVKNKDVYVAGAEMNKHTMTIAKYWKNGIGTTLTGEYTPSAAKSIYITDNGDVYIAGLVVLGNPAAVYWKNGVLYELTNGSVPARANSIIVRGNDVYVGGYYNDKAVYWKNQTPIYLTDGVWGAEVNSIAISGNTVYLAGYQRTNTGYDVARCWKYDCITNQPVQIIDYSDGIADGALKSAFEIGNKVYFCGFHNTIKGYSISSYWTDGFSENYSNGSKSEYGYSIFVR